MRLAKHRRTRRTGFEATTVPVLELHRDLFRVNWNALKLRTFTRKTQDICRRDIGGRGEKGVNGDSQQIVLRYSQWQPVFLNETAGSTRPSLSISAYCETSLAGVRSG